MVITGLVLATYVTVQQNTKWSVNGHNTQIQYGLSKEHSRKASNTHARDISLRPLYPSPEVITFGRIIGLTVGGIERLSSYVKVTRPSNSKQKAPVQTC